MFQTYEKRQLEFRQSLAEIQPSLDAALSKRPRIQSGTETVRAQLETLNRTYTEMLAELHQRLHMTKEIFERNGQYFPVSIAICILNSFSLHCQMALYQRTMHPASKIFWISP